MFTFILWYSFELEPISMWLTMSIVSRMADSIADIPWPSSSREYLLLSQPCVKQHSFFECSILVMPRCWKEHDDVIKWKHFSHYWPFVRGIHWSPVNSPHKGQWRGALMFSLICVWINDWGNNREAGDLRRHLDHYDVSVMKHEYPGINGPNAIFVIMIVIMEMLPSNWQQSILQNDSHVTTISLTIIDWRRMIAPITQNVARRSGLKICISAWYVCVSAHGRVHFVWNNIC